MQRDASLIHFNRNPTLEQPLINSSTSTLDDVVIYNGNNGSLHTNGGFMERSYTEWAPEYQGVTLVWRDLNIYSRHKYQKTLNRLINNVSGAVKPGTLVAVMGSSGAGKSTLMSALAFRNPAGITTDGDILINGRKIGPYMHRLSGYMHQEDLFVGCLTVEEHLQFMAHLKMDRKITNKDKKRSIEELLQQMGLQTVRNTRIGEVGIKKLLSGGEKKRLAFATELLTNPILLFCDEPTSGLDSFQAQKLGIIMRRLAFCGRTIICTIHQPSSDLFSLFDQIILVADGRIAFSGSLQDSLDFFRMQGYECPKNYNPADFFIRTLAPTPGSENTSKMTVKRICDQFAVSDSAKELDVIIQLEFHMMDLAEKNYKTKSDFKEPFWWNKLYWLTFRSILEVVRDPTVQTIRILQKIAIAVMAGLCFLGTNSLTQYGVQAVQGALFILISENTFTPMYSALALFPQEFPLFMREHRSGLYTPGIYYLSKIFSFFPGLVIEPTIFSLIVYWLAGLRASVYAFTMTILITSIVMNVSTACGCMFSCAFESVSLAMACLIPFDYTLMITSGLFIKLNSIPSYISWTRYLSWLMYSNEAMTIIQWQNVTNIPCLSFDSELPCLKNGTEVLENYNFAESHLWKNIIAMTSLYLIFHCIGFIFLKYRAKYR